MLYNYLIVTLRVLLKQKGYALINVAGLAAGMACCCVIFLYVADELSYDRFHVNAERIYRLTETSSLSGSDNHFVRTALPIAPVLAADFPDIEAVVRLYGKSAGVQASDTKGVPTSDVRFQEPRFFFADSTVFRVFSFPLLKGDPASALAHPNSVVITEAMAKKYFGDTDPMGRSLLYEGTRPLNITGVLRDVPNASHLQFDFLASFDVLTIDNPEALEFLHTDWLFGSLYTFVLLREGTTPQQIERRLPGFARKHVNPQYAGKLHYGLQPLTRIHLYSDAIDAENPNAIVYVYLFSTIAVLTLLIACINFINLSTARSFVRVKEIGVRKALGAHRGQIAAQFFGEALIIAATAFVISIALVEISLPAVNALTDKHLSLLDGGFVALLGLVGVFVCTALLAGGYPALIASRSRPVVALRGGVSDFRLSGARLRKMLVVVQFAISIILIAGAVVVSGQMMYMRSLPVGFQRDQMITIPLFSEDLLTVIGTPMTAKLRGVTNAFEDALQRNPHVEAVTLSSVLPGNGTVLTSIYPEGRSTDIYTFVSWMSVDYDFTQAYKLKVLAGRTFSREKGTDRLQAFIINETAAKSFGWTASSAVGKQVRRGDATGGKAGTVIGVVRDFHIAPLRESINPLVMDVEPGTFGYFSIRVRNEDLPSTIAFLERTWKEFFPHRVFEYQFLDRQLDDMYRSEDRLSSIVRAFALLAVFISCLGLFGLASFTTTRRTKEIGVRRILGASVLSVVLLLAAEYTALVLAAMSIALPAAWWGAHYWLEKFAYRIEPGPWLFLAVGVATLTVALLTVSWLSVRAATRNPVFALRHE